MVGITIFSFPNYIRIKWFEFFMRFHWILNIAIIVLVLIHSGGLAIAGIAMYGVDILVR